MQYMATNAPKSVIKLKTKKANDMINPPKKVINLMPIT